MKIQLLQWRPVKRQKTLQEKMTLLLQMRWDTFYSYRGQRLGNKYRIKTILWKDLNLCLDIVPMYFYIYDLEYVTYIFNTRLQ